MGDVTRDRQRLGGRTGPCRARGCLTAPASRQTPDGRRRSSELEGGRHDAAYSPALAACVLLAPVAQIGSIALLFVPFIILRPVLSKAWWLLAVTYAHWYYSPIPYTSAAPSVVTLLLAAALVLFPLREERRTRGAGFLSMADASRAAA